MLFFIYTPVCNCNYDYHRADKRQYPGSFPVKDKHPNGVKQRLYNAYKAARKRRTRPERKPDQYIRYTKLNNAQNQKPKDRLRCKGVLRKREKRNTYCSRKNMPEQNPAHTFFIGAAAAGDKHHPHKKARQYAYRVSERVARVQPLEKEKRNSEKRKRHGVHITF